MGRPPRTPAFMLKHVGGPGAHSPRALRTWVALPRRGAQGADGRPGDNHWRADRRTCAARLGLGDDVRESLSQSYERWDGKGPIGMKHEDISSPRG